MLLRILCFLLIPCCVQAQKHQRIHKSAVLVDTHNDIPSSSIEKKVQFDTDLRGKTHSDLNRMFKGGLDAQMFSIFCDGEQKDPYAYANQEMDSVYAWVNRNPAKMMLVYTPADYTKAIKEKKLATLLQIKNSEEPTMKFILQNWALLVMQDEAALQKNNALKKVLKQLFVLKATGCEADYHSLLQKSTILRQLMETIVRV